MRAQNPIYPQFQPMQLYEKIAVRRCAPEGISCADFACIKYLPGSQRSVPTLLSDVR